MSGLKFSISFYIPCVYLQGIYLRQFIIGKQNGSFYYRNISSQINTYHLFLIFVKILVNFTMHFNILFSAKC